MPYKNRKKYLESQRRYYRANPEKYKRSATKRQNLVRYGVTPETFDALCEVQGNRCPICGLSFSEPLDVGGKMKKPHIDHDHYTGAVRGILCGRCNAGLGCFNDNPERLHAAAEYLLKHRK